MSKYKYMLFFDHMLSFVVIPGYKNRREDANKDRRLFKINYKVTAISYIDLLSLRKASEQYVRYI